MLDKKEHSTVFESRQKRKSKSKYYIKGKKEGFTTMDKIYIHLSKFDDWRMIIWINHDHHVTWKDKAYLIGEKNNYLFKHTFFSDICDPLYSLCNLKMKSYHLKSWRITTYDKQIQTCWTKNTNYLSNFKKVYQLGSKPPQVFH